MARQEENNASSLFDLPLDRCQSVRVIWQPHGIQMVRGLSPKTFHRNLDELSAHDLPSQRLGGIRPNVGAWLQ
jgi:hypothetical protein